MAHSVSDDIAYSEDYIVKGGSASFAKQGVTIDTTSPNICVSTKSGLNVNFSRGGSSTLFEKFTLDGHIACSKADIVASINKKSYTVVVETVQVENATFSRAVVKVSGTVVLVECDKHLPFDVRVYLYSNAQSVKIVYSFIHNLDADEPLTSKALAAAWLTAWERRTDGWNHCRVLLVKLLDGIAELKHGIGTNAMLLNPETGQIRGCPPPTPEYAISHLSMLFGFPEIFSELLDYARDEHPSTIDKFIKVWLSYCRAYNGGPGVQRKEFGVEFPDHATWRQSHSTLTAFAAREQKGEELAKSAWNQFFQTDGYPRSHDWTILKASSPEYFTDGEEAPWVTTNHAACYGVSAIVNMANIREFLQ